MKLESMPTQGQLGVVPWADSYWPSYKSGIAYRWARQESNNFQYAVHSLEELRNMTSPEIATLSPAEKYDIYVSRYDYPSVKSEWERNSPEDPTWEGLCHGWATAALQYAQPSPITLTNADGIAIPFGSSDIKALLTYFIAEYAEPSAATDFVGQRCKIDLATLPESENDTACADINAGSFHVILTNILGSKNQGFIGDRERSIEVWNQPIFRYQTRLTGAEREPNPAAAVGTARELDVETTVWYTIEQVPQYEVISNPPIGSKSYRYWLEMDVNGNILGGTYATWDRLDFVWMQRDRVPFSGYFAALRNIIVASTPSFDSEPAPIRNARQFIPVRPKFFKILSDSVGIFRPAELGLNYTNNFYGQWAIIPPGRPTYIEIQFLEFSTERCRDKVKIYEGSDGKGALLGVYSGSSNSLGYKRPQSVIVRGESALVVFVTDETNTDTGFKARYLAAYY